MNLLLKYLSLIGILLSCNSYAAISVKTANYLMGTPLELSFTHNQTIEDSLDDILTITSSRNDTFNMTNSIAGKINANWYDSLGNTIPDLGGSLSSSLAPYLFIIAVNNIGIHSNYDLVRNYPYKSVVKRPKVVLG